MNPFNWACVALIVALFGALALGLATGEIKLVTVFKPDVNATITPTPSPTITPTPSPTITPTPSPTPIETNPCYVFDVCSSKCRTYLGEPYGEENDSGMLGCYAGGYFSCLCYYRQTQYSLNQGGKVVSRLAFQMFDGTTKYAPQIRQCWENASFSVPNPKMVYGQYREVYNFAPTYDAGQWNFLFSPSYYKCPNSSGQVSAGEITGYVKRTCAKAWCEGELNGV